MTNPNPYAAYKYPMTVTERIETFVVFHDGYPLINVCGGDASTVDTVSAPDVLDNVFKFADNNDAWNMSVTVEISGGLYNVVPLKSGYNND